MVKKLVIAGGALALLSTVSLATPILSYARCGVGWLSESASDSVPLEWELKRARQMIADLKPEIEINAKRIAREKIEVAKLQQELDDTDERLAKTQSEIQRVTEDLRQGDDYYTYGTRTYTAAYVKTDLNNRFKRYKTRKATADKLDQMLTAREASLSAARERMDAMLNAKRQLEVEVENLQARLAALRVAQTSSKLNLDDSQLSQTRELLDEIATRIDVEEETMSVDVEYFGGEIDLDATEDDDDLLNEISSYFDAPSVTPEVDEAMVAIQLD